MRLALRSRVFPGVAQQVADGLNQRRAVATDEEAFLHLHVDGDVGGEIHRPEHRQRVVDDGGHRDGTPLENVATGLDLRQVDQLADEAVQTGELLVDDRETALLLRDIGDPPFAQRVDEHPDRGEGRPQLVRDRRQELVLHRRPGWRRA